MAFIEKRPPQITGRQARIAPAPSLTIGVVQDAL